MNLNPNVLKPGEAVEDHLKDAMDELIFDLFHGEKIGPKRSEWGLHDFLKDQGDSYELLAAALIGTLEDLAIAQALTEKRLRNHLVDSDELWDRADLLTRGD